MKTGTAPMHFAGSQLGEARHVCAFFNSEDEGYRVLLPFIKAGFACGNKAVHVVNPDRRHSHPHRLAEVGIDTTPSSRAASLECEGRLRRASEVIARLRALFAKLDLASESVDLNGATREVITLSSSDQQRSRVIVRTELVEDLAPVIGDRVQLQQVILNLLRNAADAMSGIDDRPRQLVIRTERAEPDHVRLTVRDAGVGLDPQGAESLFKAFYTTKSDGMGIGLSVSRSIIERHHGRIWAAPNDGPGATFAFSIPLRPADVIGARGPDIIQPRSTAGPKQTMRFP